MFTGSPKAAGAIASTEVLTKMVLYYFHERAWARVTWGMSKHEMEVQAGIAEDEFPDARPATPSQST